MRDDRQEPENYFQAETLFPVSIFTFSDTIFCKMASYGCRNRTVGWIGKGLKLGKKQREYYEE